MLFAGAVGLVYQTVWEKYDRAQYTQIPLKSKQILR